MIMATTFYSYSAGLIGPLQQPPPKAPENLAIEMIAFSSDGSALVTVRNLGTADSKVGSIYVDGNPISPSAPILPTSIKIGQAATFTLPNVSPTQHAFKVATLNGDVIAAYGPVNIYIVGTVTGTATTTITSGPITTTQTITSTYTTTTSAQTTLLSTQVQTTSTSTSMVTLSGTSTSFSTSTTPVSTTTNEHLEV